jgi:hypothetical protein
VVFLGGSLYFFRIDVAGEAGHDLFVRVTQDHDARVLNQIRDVAGGQLRVAIVANVICWVSPSLVLGWTSGRVLTIRLAELPRTPHRRSSENFPSTPLGK